MPEEIFEEIDKVADAWYTNRSHALIRIFQEWKQANRPQLPGLAPIETASVEAPAEIEGVTR